MAISLVVVSATPRATNSVSAARSTRALVSSAFPIASVYEGALTCERWLLVIAGGEPAPVDDPVVETFDRFLGLAPQLEQLQCNPAGEHGEPPLNEYLLILSESSLIFK